MRNHNNYIVSLSQVCRWLATIAESLGVQIFPGFAATNAIFNSAGEVIGVATGDHGLNKAGVAKDNFQPGINLYAKYTVLAEGCRGSLSQQLIKHFHLNGEPNRQHSCSSKGEGYPQTYALGIKELWQIPTSQHKSGHIIHTVGWPLDRHTYGGSFIYYLEPSYLAIGFAVGLDYKNPYLNPFAELQRFKQHPKIKPLFANGTRIAYGARCINEGGIQSIPKLEFPGGVLVGCSAGFLNVPKIKGIHTAMKSGMLAAEAIFTQLPPIDQEQPKTKQSACAGTYETSVRNSWIWSELKVVRNIRPAFRAGFWLGMLYAAIDTYLLRGKAPWTFKHKADHTTLKPAATCKKIEYLKPDNVISFDILSSVNLANTYHPEDQPVHLKLTDLDRAIATNFKIYAAPEQRFCPAQVYEFVIATANANSNISVHNDNDASTSTDNIKNSNTDTTILNTRLQINASNCIHCKACDIKDPTQNITWTPPEGGSGPNYTNM